MSDKESEYVINAQAMAIAGAVRDIGSPISENDFSERNKKQFGKLLEKGKIIKRSAYKEAQKASILAPTGNKDFDSLKKENVELSEKLNEFKILEKELKGLEDLKKENVDLKKDFDELKEQLKELENLKKENEDLKKENVDLKKK